jgi:nucleoside-diphosphate-sugar epimerase
LDTAATDAWRQVDLDDVAALELHLRSDRPGAIIHLAAETRLGGKDEDFAGNISQARHLLDLCESLQIPRILLASTMLVHPLGTQERGETPGMPTTPYGRSKAAMEALIRAHSYKRWSIVRPTTIWGPWHVRLAQEFITRVGRGWYVHPNVACRRSYGYVGNVCHQIMTICRSAAAIGKCYFVGDPAIELAAYVDAFSQRLRARPARRVPYRLLATAALVGDGLRAMRIPFPLSSYRLGNMTRDNIIDMSETVALAGPGPFGLEQGADLTVDWWRGYMQRDPAR